MKYKIKLLFDESFCRVLRDMEYLNVEHIYFGNATKLVFHGVKQNISSMTFYSCNGEVKIKGFGTSSLYELEWDDPVALQDFIFLANSFNI